MNAYPTTLKLRKRVYDAISHAGYGEMVKEWAAFLKPHYKNPHNRIRQVLAGIAKISQREAEIVANHIGCTVNQLLDVENNLTVIALENRLKALRKKNESASQGQLPLDTEAA